MKPDVYNDIRLSIKLFKGLSRHCGKMLQSTYPSVDRNTLLSILQQEITQRMKVNHSKVFGKDKSYYGAYLEAVQKGESAGILLRMATALETCPMLLAKRILKSCYDPEDKMNNKDLNKLMHDTTLIEDATLAYEIYLCVLFDDQNGPISNSIKDSIGREYELKLERLLDNRKIPFHNEEFLRAKGYDKTPDCKLILPIAVNGKIINWIESKAQFGSPTVHQRYHKEQYSSYWNRFGTGLVIYWFDFSDDIIDTEEKRYIVMNKFPEHIVTMDPSAIK
ncbi:uncharacterized protein C15orf41 homolog [Trichogramma pretiosum]|uniref:uncharacterized protein C15orf41 homolog n=1 Tax=Trichogramma pretiosum TaxID=7493 RepID=UPI0006C9DD0F|nr:uncharacterized protein C15orf41 homolog [Trichogramma pretiosum]